MKKILLRLLFSFIATSSIVNTSQISYAKEQIIVENLISSSKGVEGKKLSYPKFKQAELRLLKVVIPAGMRTPIHIHPAPMVIYVSKGKLKHTRADVINYFSAGDSFIESNYGEKHFVENISNKKAILFVSVASAVGMPTTIKK